MVAVSVDLRPSRRIARYLISTPSRLVGEFSASDTAVTHAFVDEPSMWHEQLHGGPFARSCYVVSVGHELALDRYPSYALHAQLLADLASLWYGKRFEYHGKLQEHGWFFMASLGYPRPVQRPYLSPFNSHPRTDVSVQLTWDTFSVPFVLFERYGDKSPVAGAFWRATRFYARALRALGEDDEIAFLHLVAALEMLAEEMDFDETALFDEQTLADLVEIRTRLGDAMEKRIRDRLRQLRRRVTLAATLLTNEPFFRGSEGDANYRLTRGELGKRVGAAYDLRSRYVHAGAEFATWTDVLSVVENEIPIGRPVLSDAELADLLVTAPTLLGMERLVRFATLRFAHKYITELRETLADDPTEKASTATPA